MYAIVDIAGHQFKVEKKQKVFVHRLEAKEGSKVNFDNVLLIDDNGKVQIGTPVVKDTVVAAKVISHLKSDKIKVFKKKRRKGYKVLNGHRQQMTEILIEDIKAVAKKPAAEKAKKTETPVEAKTAVKKTTAKTTKTAAPKKTTTTKKAAEKKTAEKKATTKKTEAKAKPDNKEKAE